MKTRNKCLNKISEIYKSNKSVIQISCDIIIKRHGGELQVETKEGWYAKFIIPLPST